MAVSVFKTACDPSYVGLGGLDSHALPPLASRLDFLILRRIVTLRRFKPLLTSLTSLTSLGLVAIACLAARPVGAQTDTMPRLATVDPADTVHSPISPGRAFFYSLLVPGSAQNTLGRHRAAVGILAVELAAIAMVRESGADMRDARQRLGDSLVMSYVDGSGNPLATPVLERRRFEDVDVSARRSHVEDWVALLIANHLFAAADAFVGASLWDVSARVSISGNRRRLILMGQITW